MSAEPQLDARAKLDQAKVAIRAAYGSTPRDLYALGTAALPAIDDLGLPALLGYSDLLSLLRAELPEIDPQLLLNTAAVAATSSAVEVKRFGFDKMLVWARLVREAGFSRPPGDLGAWVVEVPDETGEPAGVFSFEQCSVAQLERVLAAAKTHPVPPARPPAAPRPSEPARRPPEHAAAWNIKVLLVLAGLVAAILVARSILGMN